jgi:hypothetical protein
MLLLVLTFSSCTPVDYQTLKINSADKEISIISSDEFIIDSISVERFGILYFSKSLKNKSEGKSMISLSKNDNDYQVYVDSLSVLKCDDDDLSLDIIIRRKGSKVKVTKEVAQNFKHLDDIQILRGLKYNPCSKQVDTLRTDGRYK